jgi:lipopolysaccharide transport system permease protein
VSPSEVVVPQAQTWWLKFYRYAHVVRYQAYASLRAEIARTYLGVLWWLFEPTMNALVLLFVFSYLLKNKTPDYVCFLFVGTFTFQWFTNGVILASNSIIQKSGIIQLVYLPKIIFPLVSVINSTWKFLFAFSILIVFLWCNHHPMGWSYLALPLIVLAQFFLILALAIPLSLWVPYFRDAGPVIGSVIGFLGYVSGLFFRPSQVPEGLQSYFHWNPVAGLLVAYRTVLLESRWPDFIWLGSCIFACMAALAGGLILAWKKDLEIPKVANG